MPKTLAGATRQSGQTIVLEVTNSVKSSSSRRVSALDGLRGYAALVVVIGHALTVNIVFYGFTRNGVRIPAHLRWLAGTPTSSPGWMSGLFAQSPIHDLWNGSVAVSLFFVISGFVLVRAFLRRAPGVHDRRWLSFYPKRLLRLYIPIIGSMIFALACVAIYARRTLPTGSLEFNSMAFYTAPKNALTDLLIFPRNQSLDPSLWSMRPEVICSLALPIFVLIARTRRLGAALKMAIVGMIILAASLAFSSTTPSIARFAPSTSVLMLAGAFGLGAILASREDEVRAWASNISAGWWAVIVIVGMTLLNTESMVTGWGWRSPEMVGIAKSLSIFSAAILVVLSLDASRFSTFLTLRPSQWLGSRSFSIYLIHYPIVLAVATFIGPSHLVIVVGLSVVLSLLTAEAFFLVVERPGHHLANWVGRRIATRDRSRSRPINAQAL